VIQFLVKKVIVSLEFDPKDESQFNVLFTFSKKSTEEKNYSSGKVVQSISKCRVY
jgi:hypothetical protein